MQGCFCVKILHTVPNKTLLFHKYVVFGEMPCLCGYEFFYIRLAMRSSCQLGKKIVARRLINKDEVFYVQRWSCRQLFA